MCPLHRFSSSFDAQRVYSSTAYLSVHFLLRISDIHILVETTSQVLVSVLCLHAFGHLQTRCTSARSTNITLMLSFFSPLVFFFPFSSFLECSKSDFYGVDCLTISRLSSCVKNQLLGPSRGLSFHVFLLIFSSFSTFFICFPLFVLVFF